MKNRITLLYILIICTVIVFSLIFFLKNKQTNTFPSEKMEKNFKVSNISVKQGTLKELSLYDYEDNKHSLKDRLSKNKAKIIFVFSSFQCSFCIDHLLATINKNKAFIGENNILLLGQFRNDSDFLKFKEINKIEVPFFNIYDKNFELPVDDLDYPYIVITDSSLIPKSIFVPEKNYPKYVDIYLKEIYKMYYEN